MARLTPHVSFIINTGLPSADELIERLNGIQPDESWTKGQRRKGGPARGYRYSGVVYDSPLTPDVDTSVVAQLHALLDRLEPIREQIVGLRRYCEAHDTELMAKISYHVFVPFATVAWLELNHDDLARIMSFDAEFEAEYVWYPESEDQTLEWEEDPDRGFFEEDHWRVIHGTSPLAVESGAEDDTTR
jgi:hypothetical protein